MSLINRRASKGFSLIEIYVTLAIIVIVIGAVYPFFISNTKALHETETKSDLQREGQYAIKYFTDKAMETQNITKLKNVSGKVVLSQSDNVSSSDTSASIAEIEFTTPNMDSTNSLPIKYYFTIRGKSLYYKQSIINSDVKIADNIESIELQTIDGESFSNCKGLNVKVTLSKNEVKSYIIESQVYFRNRQDSN